MARFPPISLPVKWWYLGKVRGNINASDRVDIRSEGSLTGDVIAQRISIEDGAFFKGGIDIRKPGQGKEGEGSCEHVQRRLAKGRCRRPGLDQRASKARAAPALCRHCPCCVRLQLEFPKLTFSRTPRK